MSYILEALKKSQQERELGRVPTLDTSGMFGEDKEPAPTTHWGLLAVGLAAVAVVIALYAVLRVPAQSPIPPQASVPSEAASAVAPASTPLQAPPAVALDDASTVAAAGSPSAVAPARVPGIPPTEPPLAGRSAPRAVPSSAARGFPEDSAVSEEDLALDPGLDLWLEQELQRQLDAEQAAYSEPPEPAMPRPRPQRVPVPADLVEDIESFKQQVRREQGIPPPLEQRKPADIRGDPTKLRLTPLQQAQLPAYFMTVHVYDEDAAKRFVLINALRYVEGEETRDGIRVERIIPEGAVLSYMGNPFFVRR
jgi:general secretion pathway protein B